MSTELPRISVVTPSFNQAQFLERTIRSVLDQDYPNLEYFVLDGGSTDGSIDIIKRYADQIDYWVSQPDGGQAAAINAGWRRATGEILCWLNSDDYYLPGALNFVGDYFGQHRDDWVIYGSWEAVDAQGRHLNYAGSTFRRWTMILSRNVIPQPASFVSRRAIDAVGYLDETLHYTMDLDLFLRIAQHRRPTFVSRPLAAATMHPDSKTLGQRPAMARERYQIRLRYASTWERPLVRIQPIVSRVFHALPDPLQDGINSLRPRRKFGQPAHR